MEPIPGVAAIPSGSPGRRRGAIRTLLALILFVNAFVIAMTGLTLWQTRQHALETATVAAQNLTQVLENDLKGDIRRVALGLFALRQEMARQMAGGGIQGPALDAYISSMFTQFPELSSIRTANAEGLIDHGIGVEPGSRFSVSDRAYFNEARRNPEAGLLISEPVVGRISGQWVVIFARRVDHPGGAFAGVAYVAVALDRFTQSMNLLDLGPNGTVTLRGTDLTLYAKYPAVQALGSVVGRRTVSVTFQELLRQGRPAGVYTAHGGLDGIERTFAYRKVGDFPLIIHVGLASEDYLAQWRKDARRYVLLDAIFVLISAGLAWPLHRSWRRERKRAQQEVHELRGMLPICATCKKIRDDAGYWNQIESYVQAHSTATFTHGICPDCAAKLLAEIQTLPPKA